MRKQFKLLIALLLMMAGCDNMAPETVEETPGIGNCSPQYPGMDITWDNYVNKVILRNCITCHQGGSSPGNGNFTTYEGVKAHLGQFNYRVIGDRADMPQGKSPLLKTTRDSLNIWISNCAPQK